MRTKIIYEDKQIIVCHKPAGIAVQTSHIGQQDVVSELKNYMTGQARTEAGGRSSSGMTPFIGVVHRLDQPVEGLLVFAKTGEAAAKLNRQLSAGTLNKHYYAVVCGQPAQKTGELVDYLVKEGSVGRIGREEEKEAKCAILQYAVKAQIGKDGRKERLKDELALLDIHIETGRFHQIRLQMANAGHPLLGDLKYGTKESIELSWKYHAKNVALYAYHLKFYHPVTGRIMEFLISPELPDEWKQ